MTNRWILRAKNRWLSPSSNDKIEGNAVTAPAPARPIDLLIVDDDAEFRTVAARHFVRDGYQVQEAGNGQEALEMTQRRQFDVTILDLRMPGMSGLEVLEKLRAVHPECEVIILTGEGTVETAVQAMKLGAYDYLTKPFSLAELKVIVQKAYERRLLDKENRQLKAALRRAQPQTQMIGESPGMLEVFRLIERAGPTDKAILIQGESGTGKELVARALHQSSLRAEKPLVVINCAALPETLLESELFGHERGAFTGAVSAKPGLFEMADGGTLLIDEIGEMPGPLQAKLLRVLEDGSMRRIGSLKERRVNVRLLAATNRNLQEETTAGRFREDLFYRINVMSLELPPLRQRGGDVKLLVKQFLGPDWEIEPEALVAMERHPWPGNVRQLSNVIERAKILADGGTIRLADLPAEWSGPGLAPAAIEDPPSVRLDQLQREHIQAVLQREGGNKTYAARALGLSRHSLYRLLKKYRLLGEEEKAQGQPPENAGNGAPPPADAAQPLAPTEMHSTDDAPAAGSLGA
ncbi:MAG: sigma-54-dependent Fis family transcriptional regulator [Planctomycetia bacterium]|nr:sigma-54-dependent Fis family transcriptional regulator [Planctomycetia bacterium]